MLTYPFVVLYNVSDMGKGAVGAPFHLRQGQGLVSA